MSSKLLRVNSRYRVRGTQSQFQMNFNARELDGVRSIKILRASLNRTFPNIYEPLNTLTIYYPHTLTTQVYTIQKGNYTAPQLAAAIEAQLTGIAECKFDTTLGKFTFRLINSNVNYGGMTLLWETSTINWKMGLMQNFTLALNFTLPVSSTPQLGTPDVLYIESDIVAPNRCIDSFPNSYIPPIGFLDFNDVPFGYTSVYEPQESIGFELNYAKNQSGTRTLQSFDVYITDCFGNVVPMEANAFLDMILLITYGSSD